MLLEELRPFVRQNVPDHLQGLWNSDIEFQANFSATNPEDGKFRVPHDGNGTPTFDDHAYHPPMEKLTALGPTGWNYVDGRSVYNTIDIDHVMGHVAGHSAETIDDLLRRLILVPEVEIIFSKGGRGLHVRLYFDPDNLPLARTRKEHIANCVRSLAWLSGIIGLDLGDKADAVGVVAWIHHIDRKPDGFKQIKRSTASMPEGWDTELPAEVRTDSYPEHEDQPITNKHRQILSDPHTSPADGPG
jgi:hypothetical protein